MTPLPFLAAATKAGIVPANLDPWLASGRNVLLCPKTVNEVLPDAALQKSKAAH